MVDRVLTPVLPWVCVRCGDAGAGIELCPACLDALPWLDESLSRLSGPGVSGRAALAYRPPVDGMVTALKYHRQRVYGRLLGELLAIRLQELPLQDRLPDCLLPVPLHRRRLRTRGYNQAALIARVVGYELRLPVVTHCLSRVRHADSQTGLGRGGRLQNLAGTFVAHNPVAGAHVAIVDDVITTGATLRDCTRALLAAGAESVTCWVAARALLYSTGVQALNGSKV
ncbi:MAG: ComF family protein [Gammaproteobacteria bacterium]|nr:ComF family protein [Gammaproteobacteria bacterium]NND53759.1 ComF family protein [Gammaproteobacteria bacterium]